MKINWFSPVPPTKTTAADYTVCLLPHLAKKAEITVWTPQEQWDRKLEKYATIQQFSPATLHWKTLREADISFYNLGNNSSLYSTTWYISRRHSGIVILQDTHFQNLFSQLYLFAWQASEVYSQKLAYYYGRQAQIDVERFMNKEITIDYLSQYYPLTELTAENALGAIVFSKKTEDELKQKNNVVEYIQFPKNATNHKNDSKLSKYTELILDFALKQSITKTNQ